MTKVIKYTFGIIIGVIALLLIIPFFISLDTYKETIAFQVKKHTGHDLKIDGNISIDVLPVPQIKLTNLKLSSLIQTKPANLLEIESVSGKLALSPLIKGKIVISRLELIKPVINLERLKSGKGNWEFDGVKEVANSSGTVVMQMVAIESKNSLSSLPFIINDISIQKGLLKYTDKGQNISIDDLDLNITLSEIYNPANSSSNYVGSSQLTENRGLNKSIDLSSLNSANGTIRFKAKKFKSANFVFENISMKSELAQGRLKLNSLTGSLYGGEIEGTGSISYKNNQPLELKLTLKNAQLQNIVPEESKIKVTGGLIDFTCDIKSFGFSKFDYIKNMHGSINLIGRDGKISGIDLYKLIHALDKPIDIKTFAQNLQGAIGKGETAFNSIKMDASVDKGIMDITKCELISSDSSASSVGKVNLLELTLDVFSTINSGVKYLPPITIHFYGHINNLQHKIDIGAIWQYLLNNALVGVIDNLKQGKIKPQDLLKGIMPPKENKPSESSDEGAEHDNKSLNDEENKLLEKGIKGLFK